MPLIKKMRLKKINILNYIGFGLITLILVNCGNKTESKSTNEIPTQTELTTEQKTDFVYAELDKKIELIFENYERVLEVGKPTKAKFKTENINNQRLAIFGAGLAMNETDNEEFRFVITPIKEYLKNGNLEIKILENLDNGETFTHVFLVPVKSKTNKN